MHNGRGKGFTRVGERRGYNARERGVSAVLTMQALYRHRQDDAFNVLKVGVDS